MGDDDLSPMGHRVAGCHKGTPSDIMINKSGQILKPYKPLSNPTFDPNLDISSMTEPEDLVPVALNELKFYSLVATSPKPDFEALRKITPKFGGSKMVNGVDHLLLENYTSGMKHPCVMDIKVGKARYYPGRSEIKAKMDHIKYPCLQEFGFCIAGIQLHDPSSGELLMHHMPKTARKFSSLEVVEHVNKFLHWDCASAAPLRAGLLKGAQAVLDWMTMQRSIRLRGSSILFVYDAAALAPDADGVPTQARVGMIDFAHVFHTFGQHDDNYLAGVKNLVEVLKTGQLPK